VYNQLASANLAVVSVAECGRKGIAVKPRKGDALLFWSLAPDSKTKDMTSMHGGCPVIKGDKWSATK
jgi:prolyl 4-hydroxylase